MAEDQNPLHTNNNGSPRGNGRYRGEYMGENRYSGELRNDNTDPDEIDLRRLFFVLWRHKWLIIAVTFICTILAGVYAYTRMPIYQSEGTMIIKQSQNGYSSAFGSDSDLGSLISSSYGIGLGSNIANELQVLKSRSLSNEVAQKLIDDPIMNNGRMYPLLWSGYPEDSAITTQDTVAQRIRDNMTVSQVDREADVVKITFDSPSPLASSKVVDMVMNTYSNLSTEQNRQMASSALKFLKGERKRISGELNQSSDSLRQFMNKNKLVQVDAQSQELISNMAELEGKKQEIKGELVAANSGIQSYEEQLDKLKPGLANQYSEALAPKMSRYQYQLAELETEKMLYLQKNPGLRDNPDSVPKIKELDDKISLLKKQINKQAKQLIDESDQYLGFLGSADGNLAQDITKIHQKLIELKVQKSQYQAQQKVLDERLAQQRQFFNQLPDNMIQLARLKRNVEINEQLYKTVANQYAEMQLWEQTQFGLGRPVDYGYVPEQPVKPQKKLYVLVGFILGGILSVGYIFSREALNNTIDGAEKLRRRDYPVLAVIPDMSSLIKKRFSGRDNVEYQNFTISTRLVTLVDSISPISESFRRLMNNIIYSNPDENYQTILVTSSSKGEGKTTVAGNLAVALSEAGKKVLLVDVDYRRPYIHKLFGITQSPGLMELIFDEARKEEVVRNSPMNNVDVISTGRRPPNPAAINQSSRLKQYLDEFKTEYDHIIIDTAPYGIITDAAPLIRQVDGVILVTRFNKTSESELDHTLENLDRVKAPVIGTVLSAFNHEKSTDYYYSYDYYRYNYDDYYEYHKTPESS